MPGGAIELSGWGYWLSFSPDGRFAFVAESGDDRVAIVDATGRRVVKRIGVGRHPKRSLVLEMR